MAREYSTSTEVPQEWTEHYTPDDKAAVARALAFLREARWQASYLANVIGVSQSMISQVLAGKYPAPVSAHLAKVLDVVRREEQRSKHHITKTTFVETSVYEKVAAACYRAHLYRKFAVVSCSVGTGKTRALEHYCEQHPNTILIAADPAMTAGRLLDDLIDTLDARSDVRRNSRARQGTQAERYGAVLRALTGTDKLLILDEAETVSPLCLEYVRRISDKAEIGVVLSGTERLWPMVREAAGRFGQISSRVIFWPEVTKSISPNDCRMLAEANLPGSELSDEVHDALWQVCDGSARVLCEALITGLKDYGLRRGKVLDVDFVFSIGHKVLNYHPKAARRAAPPHRRPAGAKAAVLA